MSSSDMCKLGKVPGRMQMQSSRPSEICSNRVSVSAMLCDAHPKARIRPSTCDLISFPSGMICFFANALLPATSSLPFCPLVIPSKPSHTHGETCKTPRPYTFLGPKTSKSAFQSSLWLVHRGETCSCRPSSKTLGTRTSRASSPLVGLLIYYHHYRLSCLLTTSSRAETYIGHPFGRYPWPRTCKAWCRSFRG